LTIVALTGGHSRPEPGAAQPASPAVGAVSTEIAPRPANPATASAPASEELLAPVEVVSASATAVVPVPPHGGLRHAPKAASSAAKESERPSHADPNAVINPFE